MDEIKKKFELTVLPEADDPSEFSLFMFDHSESGSNLLIQFANSYETDDKINITVGANISIPANRMRSFLLELIKAMNEYEKEFNNGLGISLPESNN